MEAIGLTSKIIRSVADIDLGRKGLSTKGKEGHGRISYERGIRAAHALFLEVQKSANPRLIVLAESVFLQEEFHYIDENDADANASLTQAIQGFIDALRCLKVVKSPALYKAVEAACPTVPATYRVKGLPKDAFCVACSGHITRLRNSLRTPGINMLEKELLKQRIANMITANAAYHKLQENALK